MAGATYTAIFIGVGGVGLAHVVAQYGKTDDQVFPLVTCAFRCIDIEAVAGMCPDVALWVPLRVLCAADEGGKFRKIL